VAPEEDVEYTDEPLDEAEEWDEEYDDTSAVAVATEAAAAPRKEGPRHIMRDYSYVRAELTRIAALGGFLLVALIIVSIFR
jgi:hypothetical protein